jgi:hypothetical protein
MRLSTEQLVVGNQRSEASGGVEALNVAIKNGSYSDKLSFLGIFLMHYFSLPTPVD